MTTTPGEYDITVYQGATFSRVITWHGNDGELIDLTGYTARLQARETVDAANTFIDLTTENGGIVLGGSAGTVTLSMTDEATAAITATAGVYDLELEDAAGNVTRLLQGKVTVSKEVTRA